MNPIRSIAIEDVRGARKTGALRRTAKVSVLVLSSIVLAAGCASPRSELAQDAAAVSTERADTGRSSASSGSGGDSNGGGGSGSANGGSGGGTNGGGSGGNPSDASTSDGPDGPKTPLTCNAGFHRCGDECKADDKPESCGPSCMACPSENGVATCTNGACAIRCNEGFHLCQNKCKSNSDLMACGDACIVCGANQTCENGQCTAACGKVGQGCCSGTCPGALCTNGHCCPSPQVWNGSACVDCNCNTSPHCGGPGVITESCNQTTGKCDQATVETCSGGRTCINNRCDCEPPKLFNGTTCVPPCPTCKTAPYCSGTGKVVAESCDANQGKCVEKTVESCSNGKVCLNSQCACQPPQVASGSGCANPCNCTKSTSCNGNSVVTYSGKCDANGACIKTTKTCGDCQSCTGNGTCTNDCSSTQMCSSGTCQEKCGRLAQICCGDSCTQANTYCSFESGNHHCLGCGDVGNFICGVGRPSGTEECQPGLAKNDSNFCVSCGDAIGLPTCTSCGKIGQTICTTGTACTQGMELSGYCLKPFPQ